MNDKKDKTREIDFDDFEDDFEFLEEDDLFEEDDIFSDLDDDISSLDVRKDEDDFKIPRKKREKKESGTQEFNTPFVKKDDLKEEPRFEMGSSSIKSSKEKEREKNRLKSSKPKKEIEKKSRKERLEDMKRETLIPRPQTIKELGISREMLMNMSLKHLYYAGEMTGLELANRLKVPYKNIIDKIIDKFLKQKIIYYEGGRGFGRSSMSFTLTDAGKKSAIFALDHNRYVGPLPVSLNVYKKVFENLKEIKPVKLSKIKELLSDLVLPDNFQYNIGPAINSNHSIFLYGPPGNGKSVVADKIAKNLDGYVTIPHAIEIDGQIIKIYDKIFHKMIKENENDQRWLTIKRPYIFVGGELTYDMLNLNYDPVSKVYEAPLQLKANGGIFLIDDFGRQKEEPKLFLNRWIVPLENRFDVLNLSNGKSFIVPFEELIIFSTNLDPLDLIDDAFARRIRYKIGMNNPNPEMFLEIFRRMCKIKKMDYILSEVESFFFFNTNKTPKIRAVLPRDLIEIIDKICEFENIPREVNFYTLKKASEIGFIQDYAYEDKK